MPSFPLFSTSPMIAFEVHLVFCAFSRLPETKLKLISASVAEEHLKAVHSFLAKRLEEETQSDVNTALRVEVLKEREAHLRERSAGLKQELSLMHQRLPPLVHSLTHMQLTALDHRSCDLKLARQNYFLSKLDKVCLVKCIYVHNILSKFS